MNEIWKDVPGFKGKYQASTHGRIRNIINNKILNQYRHETRGHKFYLKCSFNGKSTAIHRIIALTFIPNPENKHQVDHIDYNEQNNRVDNLKWVTPKENQQHSAGRMRNKKAGEDHYRAIITNKQWEEAKRLNRMGIMFSRIARYYGVNPNLLHAMAYRERKYTKRAKKIGET